MQYLCLVYLEQVVMDSLTPDEGRALVCDSLAYDEELQQRGHYINSNALQPTTAATCVRVRNGRLSTMDGPFAETKEHLGGYILIEAADLNAAIRVAAGIPCARYGTIEVRPVMALTMPQS